MEQHLITRSAAVLRELEVLIPASVSLASDLATALKMAQTRPARELICPGASGGKVADSSPF